MSENMQNKDYRTLGIVLRRTNYGEADRILNIITPKGKISAIAKAARKSKSKLAGGIEMFARVDLNLHQGKSDFAIITSAKMVKSYHNIIKDYSRMELASAAIKRINQISENSDSPKYYDILDQTLNAINSGVDSRLIEAWFRFNTIKASGEQINLYRDTNGEKLQPEQKYFWDYQEKALSSNPKGDISANEIKVMRLIIVSSLATIAKIKNIDDIMPPIFKVAQSF